MFGSVAKIPISNTFNELVEMDFSDYAELATFMHIRDTFRDFRRLRFTGKKSKRNKPRKW